MPIMVDDGVRYITTASWDAGTYDEFADTTNTRRSIAVSESTYGRILSSDRWEQLQYRDRAASSLQRRHPTTIVDDVEYRTVDNDRVTLTATAEDVPRGIYELGRRSHIVSTPSSVFDEMYNNYWTSVDNGPPVFTFCGVSAQPIRPRITFGEL